MIYYFSGTGNSKEVAERLAASTNDIAMSITNYYSTLPEDTASLGFVFPVYAWGIPKIFRAFIKELKVPQSSIYTYMVCTCGDDIGLTDYETRALLSHKGITLNAAWSVRMPNTYIALPGFDIDSETLTQEKLHAAILKIADIGKKVILQEKVTDVTPGTCAWIKSRILRPLFNRLLTGESKFKVDHQCIHCGKCVTSCPTSNIRLDDKGNPHWQGHCADCLSCYHSCPKHAINYGPFTKRKGQYLLQKALGKQK